MRHAYRHKQFGSVAVLASGAAILLVLVLTGQLGAHPLLLLLLGLLAFVLVMFSSLTVMVTASSLVFWFGPGILRKTVPLAEVSQVEVVRNPWYYGWGIRFTPRGMLYAVSGLDAVELTRRDGSRLRIGTDEPGRLERALRQALERFG